MKYSLKFYKHRVKSIAQRCGMGRFELVYIDHIRSWEEMLALIEFIKDAYRVPAYEIGPVAIRTPQELAEFLRNNPIPTPLGEYNEWEM